MKRTIHKTLIMVLAITLFYLTITIQGAYNENPDNFMQQNELNLNPPFHHSHTILNIDENERSYKIIEFLGKLKTPMLNVFVLTNSFYILCLLSWVFVGEKNKCIFDASCPENTNYFIEHFKILYLSWDWILYFILCLNVGIFLSPLKTKITNIPIDQSIENLIKLFESKLACHQSFEFICGLWDNKWLKYFDPLTLKWVQSFFFDTLEANEPWTFFGTRTFRIANKNLRLLPFWTRNFKIVSKFIFSCEMKTPNKLACNTDMLSQLNTYKDWKECWEEFFPQYFDKIFNHSLPKKMMKILPVFGAQHLLEMFSDSMDNNVLPNISSFHDYIPPTSGSFFDILFIIFVEQIGLKILSEYLLFVTLPQFITNLFVFIKNLFLLGDFYDIVFTKK